MQKTSALVRPAVFSRIALFALLIMMTAAATLHLSAFTAQAGQATLSWTAPTTYTNGTAITNLGGYKVYTGTSSGNYFQSVDVGNATSYYLSNLSDATTYYFAITAYDTAGDVSAYSNEVTKTTLAAPPPVPVYTLTASAGSGGSITPAGATAISQGLSQSFTISPSTGYKIAGVTVDGASVGAVSTYTFSNLAANHSIAASFATNVVSYTISAAAGTGGSISPAGSTTVNAGGSQAFTSTPAAGYQIAGLTVDGAALAAAASYTFSSVQASHSIQASFAPSASSNVIFAVNAGGTAYTSSQGVKFLADANYSSGLTASTTATTSGTTDTTLYKSERFGNFAYSVPATNGNYNVTLKFAEIYWTATGKRVFNVQVNGQTVISNLDIFAKVGINKAYDVVIPVSVTNGAINVNFVSLVDWAKVSAISIQKM